MTALDILARALAFVTLLALAVATLVHFARHSSTIAHGTKQPQPPPGTLVYRAGKVVGIIDGGGQYRAEEPAEREDAL